MFCKRITVLKHERVLLTKNGHIDRILMPGSYKLFHVPCTQLEIEKFSVLDLKLESRWAEQLLRDRPQLVARHFTAIETSEVQVAMVYADDRLFCVMPPASRLLFWRGAARVTAEIVQVLPYASAVEDDSDIFRSLDPVSSIESCDEAPVSAE